MTAPFDHSANAASATWNATPTSDEWVITNGTDNNWSTGVGTYPGSTSGTTNTDTATFLTSSTTTIDLSQATNGLNVKSIVFGSSTVAPSAYTIGASGANAGVSLLLTSAGSITLPTFAATALTTQTFNAPIVLEPATSTTAGTYTFGGTTAGADNALSFAGNISGGTTTSTVTLILGSLGTATGVTGSISGVISNGGANLLALTRASSATGTWTLSGANTYTGATQLLGGTTVVSSINSTATGGSAVNASSSLGAPALANATIVLGVNSSSAVLSYVGGGETTNRAVSFGGQLANPSTITASGSGAVVFTGNFTVTGTSGNSARGLALNGTNTGNNAINGTITDGTGLQTVAVMKSNAGTWVLGGSNSYSGGTTISGGTLVLGNTAAAGAVGASINLNTTGSVLDLATDTTVNAYNLTVNNTVTIASDKATASSSGITQALGTLSIASAGSSMLNITAGANATSGSPAVSFGATSIAGTGSVIATLNPTTASVTLASVTGSSTGSAVAALTLDGSATGNAVTGAIADGSGGGTLRLVKSNTSTWTLSSSTGSGYTGGTTISGGTLVASNSSGSATGAGAVALGAATGSVATLASGTTGLIGGTVTTNGKATSSISPGGSGVVGMLTLNALTVSSGSSFAFDLGSTNSASTSDRLAVTNALTASSTANSLVFNFTNLGVTANTTYTLATYGSEAGLALADLTANGLTGNFSITNLTGGSGEIDFTVTSVPEPGTWVSGLLMSAVGMVAYRRHFRNQRA